MTTQGGERNDDQHKAADRLARQITRLLEGPPDGTHMKFSEYLDQWAEVRRCLQAYRDFRGRWL